MSHNDYSGDECEDEESNGHRSYANDGYEDDVESNGHRSHANDGYEDDARSERSEGEVEEVDRKLPDIANLFETASNLHRSMDSSRGTVAHTSFSHLREGGSSHLISGSADEVLSMLNEVRERHPDLPHASVVVRFSNDPPSNGRKRKLKSDDSGRAKSRKSDSSSHPATRPAVSSHASSQWPAATPDQSTPILPRAPNPSQPPPPSPFAQRGPDRSWDGHMPQGPGYGGQAMPPPGMYRGGYGGVPGGRGGHPRPTSRVPFGYHPHLDGGYWPGQEGYYSHPDAHYPGPGYYPHPGGFHGGRGNFQGGRGGFRGGPGNIRGGSHEPRPSFQGQGRGGSRSSPNPNQLGRYPVQQPAQPPKPVAKTPAKKSPPAAQTPASAPSSKKAPLHELVNEPRRHPPWGGKYIDAEAQKKAEKKDSKEVFDRSRQFSDDNQCGNCGHFGHTLADCLFPDDSGFIMGCPAHNTKRHHYDGCKHSLTLEQRAELLARRGNGPQIRSAESLQEQLQSFIDAGAEHLIQTPLPWTVDHTRSLVLAKNRADQPWLAFDYGTHPAGSLPADGLTGTRSAREVIKDQRVPNDRHAKAAEHNKRLAGSQETTRASSQPAAPPSVEPQQSASLPRDMEVDGVNGQEVSSNDCNSSDASRSFGEDMEQEYGDKKEDEVDWDDFD
ncbi:hypothetical protein K4K58_002104 [Colletotrichum sp. SAR11_239]|nr:hypothetical protein K4K58_002104 [Colletotrichum sp. SAR11_239]